MTTLRLILDWDMVLEHYDQDGRCGPPIEPESLPLSRKTANALWARYKRWSTLFLDSEDESSTPLDRELDWRLLDREGLILWKCVREELGPSYQVVYYSEILHRTFKAPEEYDQAAA